MSRPVRPQSSDPEWDGDHRDLDAVGLAAHFADYTRHRGTAAGASGAADAAGDQREAIGAWLDELIAELEREADESRP